MIFEKWTVMLNLFQHLCWILFIDSKIALFFFARISMIAKIVSFTDEGKKVENLLKEKIPEIVWRQKSESENLGDWTADAFSKRIPLVFVSAVGIAVREVAPFVKDKLSDSPVVVVDEKCGFAVPVLSGHFGGANDIARLIAEKTGAKAVITTATDVEGKFAADVFARKNSLQIMNRDGIKKVSSKILKNEKIKFWIESGIKILESAEKNLPDEIEIIRQKDEPEAADIKICGQISSEKNCSLWLRPKNLCIGIGCKKGKTFAELKSFLMQTFQKKGFNIEEISCFSSIDIKKNEAGLLELAQFFGVPFLTFSSSELENAEGDFSESEFVRKITGVPNVCERAAALSCGKNAEKAELLLKKTCGNGITLAVSRKNAEIKTWR